MKIDSLSVVATHDRVAELDRLGDEIAELSAHLDAATARLLDLIRECAERAGRVAGGRPAPRGPSTARASGRGRYGRHPRPPRAGGRRRGHEGAGGGTGDSVSEIVADVRGRQRGSFLGNADDGPAASRCAGPARRDIPQSW